MTPDGDPKAIVAAAVLGVVLLLASACAPSLQSYIDEVTTLDAGAFGEAQQMPAAYTCAPVLVPVESTLTTAEHDAELDEIVTAEANAFEQAGWKVRRYSGSSDSWAGPCHVGRA